MKTNSGKYKPYPIYKPSGVGWLGEIPEHWKEKRFCFLFSFSKGLNITKENLRDEGIPCVNYGEIHSKYGFEVNPEKNELKCVDEKYVDTSTESLLKYGNFVFADTSEDIEGSGNFTYLSGNTRVFAGYHTIIARPVANIVHRYIAFLFDSIDYRTQIRSEVTGIKVYSITKTILKDTVVFLPPLPEQRAIAAFLDRETAKIDALVEKERKMIELLKEKRSALITNAVTKGLDPNVKLKPSGVEWIGEIPEHWEVRRWRFLCKPVSLRIDEKNILEHEKEISFVPMEDIPETDMYLEPQKVSMLSDVINGYTYFRNDDILIAKITPCFENGKGCIANNLINSIGFGSTELYVYRPNKEIAVVKYLFLVTKLSDFRGLGEASMKGSAGQQRVPEIFVKDFFTPLPSLSEQRAIAAFLDRETAKIDKLIGKIEQQIELLIEYRQSLITSAVTGKIDVSNSLNTNVREEPHSL